jgi:hypothetical protein
MEARMKKRSYQSLGLILLLVLLIADTSERVAADGTVITIVREEVKMPSQKAILVYDEKSGHEDLILSVELLGGTGGAWVVPVPSLPQVKVASPDWFQQLDQLTAPRIEYNEAIRCDDRRAIVTQVVGEQVEAVQVVSREQVGIYDVSILSAKEPGALLDWLNENGYAFPVEGKRLLDAYVRESIWYFVAARVSPEKTTALQGDVQPLWLSFDAWVPIYPMRLTALMKDNIDVLVYVLADHRMEIEAQGFATEFAGELTLQPQTENVDLPKLLTIRPYYVTKLRNGALYAPQITVDFYPRRAASDEAYREVIYRTKYVCPPTSDKPTPTEGLCVTPALLVLPAGLILGRWRSRSRLKHGRKV